MHAMPEGKSWPFVRAFWQTMMREWTGIDRLRLNKFYDLMARSVQHSVQSLASASWSIELIGEYASVLGDTVLAPSSPSGLRYFFADRFLAILSEAVVRSGESGGLSDDGTLRLLDPFISLLSRECMRWPSLRMHWPSLRMHWPSRLACTDIARARV